MSALSRANSLGFCLAALIALFAAPLPAHAIPTVCTINAVCIDESIEGATPTVTWNSSVIMGANVVTLAPEEYVITFDAQFTNTFVIGFSGINLLESVGGPISDGFFENGAGNTIGTHVVSFDYQLESDTDTAAAPAGCLNLGRTVCLPAAVENGEFQLAATGDFVDATPIDVYLKSDVEAVPEPASLALFASALVGFGVIRRQTHNLRRRNYQFMTISLSYSRK
jgi:hypothetical protein